MSWFFDLRDFRLGHDESLGGKYILGEAKQDVSFRTNDTPPYSLIIEWRKQHASFSIYPNTASELAVDPVGDGKFYDTINGNLEKTFCQIECFAGECIFS